MPSRFAFQHEPRRRATPSRDAGALSLFERIATPTTKAQASPASHQAAGQAEWTAAKIARACLRAYAGPGAAMTADECALRIGLGGQWHRVRPRVSNLLHARLLQATGIQRPSANGAPADVLAITGAGHLLLASGGRIPRPPRARAH